MSESLKEIRTPHGLLAAEVKTTIHCDWLTYSYVKEKGKVGLEGIFEAAYGKPMDMTECPNDTDFSMDIKKEVFNEWDQQTVDEAVARGHFAEYSLRTMMTDLCNKGILPEASYVVTMSW